MIRLQVSLLLSVDIAGQFCRRKGHLSNRYSYASGVFRKRHGQSTPGFVIREICWIAANGFAAVSLLRLILIPRRCRRHFAARALEVFAAPFDDLVQAADHAFQQATKSPPRDRVPPTSLIAVVKLVVVGIVGQAHGSRRGRHFDRLIMAWDILARSRCLSGSTNCSIIHVAPACLRSPSTVTAAWARR